MGRRVFSGISSCLLSARGFTDLLYMVLPVGLQSLMVMGDGGLCTIHVCTYKGI